VKETLRKEYQSLNIVEIWKKIRRCANQLLDIVEKKKRNLQKRIETEVRQQI